MPHTSIFFRIPYQLVIIPEMSKILNQSTEEQLFDRDYNDTDNCSSLTSIVLSRDLLSSPVCADSEEKLGIDFKS